MITSRIPALLLALTPFWSTASFATEEVQQIDPVVAIDEKIDQKKADIDAVNQEYDSESANLKQLQLDATNLTRQGAEIGRQNATVLKRLLISSFLVFLMIQKPIYPAFKMNIVHRGSPLKRTKRTS